LSDASDRSAQRPYSDEFRRDVVRLITDEGYSIPAAANACGVSDQTVRNWYGRFGPAAEAAGDEATMEELRAEVARLRKQLRRAELERAILEKATARRRRFDCPLGAFAKGSLFLLETREVRLDQPA
jgi:transposase